MQLAPRTRSKNEGACLLRNKLFPTCKMYVVRAGGLTVICLACLGCKASAANLGQRLPLLLQGRFGGAQGAQSGYALPVLYSWPASSLYATFVGDSVNTTLSALPPTITSRASSRFAFYIDQRQLAIQSATVSESVIQWSATGLGPGDFVLNSRQGAAYFASYFYAAILHQKTSSSHV